VTVALPVLRLITSATRRIAERTCVGTGADRRRQGHEFLGKLTVEIAAERAAPGHGAADCAMQQALALFLQLASLMRGEIWMRMRHLP
jgi:hypothetical protein